MSNSAGPKITKDGLVLDFDAANSKSYNFYADPYASNVSLHLKMDGANGSTTFTDSSPNALAVTAVGNAQISTTQSKYGGASAYFDGAGDYLTVASNAALAFGTGDFTIEGWIYPTDSTFGRRILQFSDNNDNLDLNLNGAGSISYYNGSSVTPSSSGVISLNIWTHIALVRSSGTVKVYVNGFSVLTQSTTPNTSSSRVLYIGGITNVWFNGYIDELKITKGVARYTSAFTSPPIPSTCTDLTKNKNVGTLTNGVDYNFSNGGSLVFDGVNDYVTVSNSGLFNFGTGDFTIDVWAKVNGYSAGAIQTLINTYTNPSAGWCIQFNVFNTLDFRFSYGDTTLIISGANAILLNEWNNLVISRINNSLVMYVNGRTVTTATDSTNIASGSALVLGRNSPSAIQFLNGNISLARIYKARGLTSGEVYNNFVANRGRFGY